MERKEFLKKLGMAGLVLPLMAACKKDDDPAAATSSGSCTATPSETEGPFPTHSPTTLVLADIRSDRTGIPLTLTITIQNRNSSCAVLQGATVDVWHCDKDGYYSEYGG